MQTAEAHGGLGECTGMTCSPCGSLMHLGTLTRKSNGKTLGTVGEGMAKWKMLSIVVDSGACDNVIDAEELPDHPVAQTKDSLSGDAFLSATGRRSPISAR